MKYIYEQITNESFTGESKIIKRTDEKGLIAWIPLDERNSDYQAYLRWLENPNKMIAEQSNK